MYYNQNCIKKVVLHIACSDLPTNTWRKFPAFLEINVLQNLLPKTEAGA